MEDNQNENNIDFNKINNDNYYSDNSDPLLSIANDIIDETIFYREGAPKPPLSSPNMNDSDLDKKINSYNK